MKTFNGFPDSAVNIIRIHIVLCFVQVGIVSRKKEIK